MIYENSPEKIQAKNIGTLPFIYDENKSKLFYLRSTKELVSDSAKYNHYYDYYRNSQNIDKFSNQEMDNNFDFPMLPNLEAHLSPFPKIKNITNDHNVLEVNTLIIIIYS